PGDSRGWRAPALLAVLVLLSTGAFARDRESTGTSLAPSQASLTESSIEYRLASQEPQDDEAARAALERGLVFLAGQQALEGDGSFPAGTRERWSPVGVTALSVL